MAVHDTNLSVGIVPLDASLASFGDINRGKWPGEFRPRTGTLFSYAMNNYWHTNYRAGQSGDFTFRYVLTSAPQFDGGALSRLGLSEMRPFEMNYVISQDKVGNPPRPLPAEGKGFMEISDPNVALITWKEAADHKGDILRLQELSGRSSESIIRFKHAEITTAQLCSGVEDSIRSLPVESDTIRISFRPFEVVTLRVASRNQ
jgi:alpha-mannosidase